MYFETKKKDMIFRTDDIVKVVKKTQKRELSEIQYHRMEISTVTDMTIIYYDTPEMLEKDYESLKECLQPKLPQGPICTKNVLDEIIEQGEKS